MREVEVAQEPQNIFETESAELKSLRLLSEISISTGITEVWGPGMTLLRVRTDIFVGSDP